VSLNILGLVVQEPGFLLYWSLLGLVFGWRCGPWFHLLRSLLKREFLLSFLVIVMCLSADTPGTSSCLIAQVWGVFDDAY